MTSLRIDLNASRWDRSPISLRQSVIASARDGVDLIGLSEVAGAERARHLRSEVERGLGWTLSHQSHGAIGEVALAARPSLGRLAWRSYVIGPDLGPGDVIVATLGLYDLGDGRTMLFAFAHLPASVEGTWSARPRRVVEYGLAVRRYRRTVNRWQRKHRPAVVVVAADWNLNARRAWVRAWIRATWPSLRLPADLPAAGDHAGGRLIVWPITRGLGDVVVRVLRADNSSDHARVRVVGEIR